MLIVVHTRHKGQSYVMFAQPAVRLLRQRRPRGALVRAARQSRSQTDIESSSRAGKCSQREGGNEPFSRRGRAACRGECASHWCRDACRLLEPHATKWSMFAWKSRTSSFPAKHAQSLSPDCGRLQPCWLPLDGASATGTQLIVDGGWPQECGGEPWSAGLGDEGLRQARGACSSCGRRRRRWQTPAALRATTWRMSARFSVSICVFFVATAAHVADIHPPPIAAWWNTGMAFFGTGIALFSSFELFDDSSATRTGKPSGAALRTRVSSSLPLISHGPTEPLPTPKGGWKVAEASGLFVANGALIMVYGTLNYFRVQRAIRRGVFPQNKLGVLAVFCSTGLPQFIPWLSDL